MNDLLFFDQQVFLFINHLPHNGLFNALGLGLSAVGTAGIVWFIIGAWLFLREEKKDHLFFIPLLSSGVLTWVLVEKIIKPLVARPRPSIDMGAIILGNTLADFSFPSGHAAIAWALAYVLRVKEPRWKGALYMLAFLISLSRIYIGKHYPGDVVAGGILGWMIGYSMVKVTAHFFKKNETA